MADAGWSFARFRTSWHSPKIAVETIERRIHIRLLWLPVVGGRSNFFAIRFPCRVVTSRRVAPMFYQFPRVRKRRKRVAARLSRRLTISLLCENGLSDSRLRNPYRRSTSRRRALETQPASKSLRIANRRRAAKSI